MGYDFDLSIFKIEKFILLVLSCILMILNYFDNKPCLSVAKSVFNIDSKSKQEQIKLSNSFNNL